MAFKLPKTIRLELVVLFVVISFVAGCYLLCACSRKPVVEGFKQAMGAGIDYMMCEGVPGDSWGCDKQKQHHKGNAKPVKEEMNYSTGERGSTDIENMLIFSKNEFKPECCPSEISSYDGCACITKDQIQFINERGGNRTMSTEF